LIKQKVILLMLAAGLLTEVPTRHSLLATCLLGPSGLLLHWLTKVCGRAVQDVANVMVD